MMSKNGWKEFFKDVIKNNPRFCLNKYRKSDLLYVSSESRDQRLYRDIGFYPDVRSLKLLGMEALESITLAFIHYHAEGVFYSLTFEFSNGVLSPPSGTYLTEPFSSSKPLPLDNKSAT